MFTAILTAAVMAVSVSATVLPRTPASSALYAVPSTYTAKWLESYDDYHTRYIQLNCEGKHNTQFFDDCCHPMLKWEKFEKARKPYCAPSYYTSSAASPVASSTKAASATQVASTAVSSKLAITSHIAIVNTKTASSAAATATAIPDEECDESDENCECTEVDDDEDDDLEDCDDEDDNEDDCEEGEEDCVCEEVPISSSAAPASSTVKASPTSSRSVVFITSTVTAASSTKPAVTSSTQVAVTSSSKAPVTTSTPVATSSSQVVVTSSKFVTSTRAATTSSAPAVTSTPAPKTTQTPSSTVQATTKTQDNVPLTQQTTGSFSTGDATFYYQGGAAGACGNFRKDTDFIAAIDYRRYGALDKKSLLCGMQAKVTNHKNGKSVTVTIEDACPTCKNQDSIDLSKSAFLAIAPEDDGEVPVTVEFVGRAY